MALAIATNNAALNAAASASSVNREMETSMARLSSGKRINSASDDAAGVAISSRLAAEIRGTDQAIRNSLDGQALIDTAEGAHKEIENILQRMREIAVQAANDTNNAQDRGNLQAEMDAMSTEIDRIAGTTTWAGANLMQDASGTDFSFQVGTATGSQNQISVSINSMNTGGLELNGGASGLVEIADIGAAAAGGSASSTTMVLTDGTLNQTGNITFTIGSKEISVDVTAVMDTDDIGAAVVNANNLQADGTTAATDTDGTDSATGHFAAYNTTSNTLTFSSVGTHSNAGAQASTASPSITAAVTNDLGARDAVAANVNRISVEDTSTGSADADDNALASIVLIDAAIKAVNVQRSELGAVSNRLNHTVNNLTNISSNLSAAKGGIEDADFALETTNLAKNQILQQASTAMLAQANASKQNVLSLLQG
jgi:flagellin